MVTIRAGLIGISGYAGMELARLLARHPSMSLTMACSRTESGRRLDEFYPFMRHLPGGGITISEYDPQVCQERCDLVFLAVPAGVAMDIGAELLKLGLKVVDFSADFRISDPLEYEKWYKLPHTSQHLLKTAVYGIPEINSDAITRAQLVANPGCYPTAAILALRAPLTYGLIEPDSIVIDAKSGASGAGRKASIANLFCEISDDFRAYGIPGHRHTPEIEQELSKIAGSPLRITFTPHLVPMKRGILATIYTRLRDTSISIERIRALFLDMWSDYPWIRILPPGELPRTVNTRGSMYCDIGLVMDKRTGRLLVISAIDNLCRGAAGQALANANLMSGLPVDSGLECLAPLF